VRRAIVVFGSIGDRGNLGVARVSQMTLGNMRLNGVARWRSGVLRLAATSALEGASMSALGQKQT
jgi:hypothetical protein